MRVEHVAQKIIDKKSTSYFAEKFREEENKEKEIIFEISYFTLIKRALCESCLNEENYKTLTKFDYAQIYVDEKLDIAYYLQLLIKFKYLLKMLLSKDERLLFNFTKKPPLKQIKTDKVEKLLNKDKKKELVNYYKNQKYVNGSNKRMSVTNLLNQAVIEYLSKKSSKNEEIIKNDII